jgi:ubiquinone/menaquinone biosynthesis C-methylase UbiE
MKEAVSNYFRKRRFGFFINFMNQAAPNSKPLRILDIGGTQQYWLNMGIVLRPNTEIVLLNLYKNEASKPGFSSIVGDACNLTGISDQSFDIVFSNSVIEHLFTYEQQQKMAKEVARVGISYFIQTPNKYFPIEPHWLFPFFQFLPFTVKVFLTQHFTLGNIKKANNKEAAINLVKEVKLLSRKEFAAFFKDGKIYKEKIIGLTKSFTAYKIANHN